MTMMPNKLPEPTGVAAVVANPRRESAVAPSSRRFDAISQLATLDDIEL